jgi:hypothetical protein
VVNVLILGIDRLPQQNSVRIGALYFAPDRNADLTFKDDASAEETLLEGAINVEARALSLAAPNALAAYFTQLFEVELRPAFEREHAFRSMGEVELAGAKPGLSIELDGTAIGETTAGATRVTEMKSGPRKLALRDPLDQQIVFETTVEVESRGRTAIAIPIAPIPKNDAVPQVIFWSGATVALAGTIAVIAGATATTRPVSIGCDGASCMDGNDAAFSRICDLGSDRGGCSLFSSTRIVPLGYALALGGAAWAIGSKFFGEELEPWIVVLLGVAGGLSAYGLSVAVD